MKAFPRSRVNLPFIEKASPVWPIGHPRLRLVPHLDLDGAAEAVVATLAAGDGDPPVAGSVSAADPLVGWVDQLLDAVEARRS